MKFMWLRGRLAVLCVGLWPTMGPCGQDPAAGEPAFEFSSGERVVFLGNTLVERAQTYAYLETFLTLLHPDRDLTFRNLGWSGDNVFGHSRSVFDPPEKGFAQLEAQVRACAPTVVFVSYGTNEAFWGKEGLPRFQDGLAHLLDTLASTAARIVIVTPVRRQPAPPPLPDPEPHNQVLALYVEALANAAKQRGHRFVDLFTKLVRAPGEPPLSENTLHLTAFGYWKRATVVLKELGYVPTPLAMEITRAGVSTPSSLSLRTSDFAFGRDAVSFRATSPRLPPIPAPLGNEGTRVRCKGLTPGRYTLRIDDTPIVTATATEWSEGVTISKGGGLETVEEIRQRSIRKNFLYFHRYRPANWPYLLGFRKHEQGNNAAELPHFDPLIQDAERAIAVGRRPSSHYYRLSRYAEGDSR